MSSTAKKRSEENGREFLQESFACVQNILQTQLEFSNTSITHNAKQGEVNEKHFISILRQYLPQRYQVDSGFVIDSKGQTSQQIDIIIFDPQYTPTLLAQQNHLYVPVEAVYAVFEVKPTINKKYLEYAGEKAASVRKLHRTSVPIPHAGGTYRPKSLFRITCGIIAIKVEWKRGLSSAFRNHYNSSKRDEIIDCGLALSGHKENKQVDNYFDNFDFKFGFKLNAKFIFVISVNTLHLLFWFCLPYCVPSLSIDIRQKADRTLIYFMFRLLNKLQSLGTVPAIDWNAYANVLSN